MVDCMRIIISHYGEKMPWHSMTTLSRKYTSEQSCHAFDSLSLLSINVHHCCAQTNLLTKIWIKAKSCLCWISACLWLLQHKHLLYVFNTHISSTYRLPAQKLTADWCLVSQCFTIIIIRFYCLLMSISQATNSNINSVLFV